MPPTALAIRSTQTASPRVVVVPGLRDSGPAHWQTWLQSLHRDALRVVQQDWEEPALDRWADAVGETLQQDESGPWIVAAHSFGCLATLRHLVRRPDAQIAGLLLVAPADPDKFGIGPLLPAPTLEVPTLLVYSDSDPWLAPGAARRWAAHWGVRATSLGDAGHINAEAGFGPLPLAQRWVVRMRQRWLRERRAAEAATAGACSEGCRSARRRALESFASSLSA